MIPSDAVNVLNFGAAGDGVTDDSAAIQRALDGLGSGGTLVLPEGRVFAHASVLKVRVAGVRITGGGTLLATNELGSSLYILKDDVTVDSLSLRTRSTTQRWAEYEKQGITLMAVRGTKLTDVVVDGPGAAGIYMTGSSGFALNRVTVTNSRADAIHITGGSHDGTLTDISVSGSGDDGVAVVSLATDSLPVRNIVVTNASVTNQRWGRAFSIVGGNGITWRNIYAEASNSASLYIAAEGEWNTKPVDQVLVDGATIVNANTNSAIDHGAVVLYNSQSTVNRNITLRNVSIKNTRASASRQVSILGGVQTSITMQNFTITNGPGWILGANVASTSYNTIGWTYNGAPVADNIGW